MERQRAEAQFKETQKTLESSKEKINAFLKQETLNDDDRVRLTRVLQLIDRYQPKREEKTTNVFQWKKYLESVFHFLPSQKNTQKPIEDISANSYLLSEKSIAALRELRRIDMHLRKEKGFTESDIVNQKRSEKVLQTETLDTSLTLEYEKKHWGVERVALDGIQNHLPSDAKGEQVWVRFLLLKREKNEQPSRPFVLRMMESVLM